ncbi:hypothetical protein J3R30DRAFT_3662069 [Lentinula aciculospora]|uniref:Proteasome inhibitor PI31 subunit n=1 Tax=Lentinula aciculospora TaxID=153920 RepID=A0A9W8ZVM4_9AGAR|nr:hypothetical protein J3R30DRAFT_3662069 [Lentinula aciculospora]
MGGDRSLSLPKAVRLAFRRGARDANKMRPRDNQVLAKIWAQLSMNTITLMYKHEQSSLKFVVKLSKLGKQTVINVIAVESDKTTTLDISTNDFMSPSCFPYNVESPSSSSPLVYINISSARITDLVSQFKLKIIQKLVLGLNSDEFPLRFTPRHPSCHISPDNPLKSGRRDLDHTNSGDGMFVGNDHPIFGGHIGQGQSGFGAGGIGGLPGARFNPVGQEFGAGPGGVGIGDPDNDKFMLPAQ